MNKLFFACFLVIFSIWAVMPVEIAQASQPSEPASLEPGAFGKILPTNGSTGLSTTVNFMWQASEMATGYAYCYDTSNDGNCANQNWISTSATTATVTGLAKNTTYYWHVRAYDNSGNVYSDGASGTTGTWWQFTTLNTLPESFIKISPVNGATNVPLNGFFQWAVSNNAIHYEFCIDITNNNTCDGTWSDAGGYTNTTVQLGANITYYWQVRAANLDGTTEADGGVWWSFTTENPVPGPFIKIYPANGATNVSMNSLFQWAPSSNASEYEFCADPIDNNLCDGSWTNSSGYTDITAPTPMQANTKYYWQARAINQYDITEADGGVWWSFTTENPVPGPFIKIYPANGATNVSMSTLLQWAFSSNASGYEFCVDPVDNNLCDGDWTNSNGYNDGTVPTPLAANTKYYWQARATNQYGILEADNGVWWSFTTEHPVPGPFIKIYPANGATNVSMLPWFQWASSSNASEYEFCADPIDNNLCDGGWTNSNGYTDGTAPVPLQANTKYYWQARAINQYDTVEADGGTWWSFTTENPVPGPFIKIYPANGATNVSIGGWVQWANSSNASEYAFCIDTTNDMVCDGDWTSTGMYPDGTPPAPLQVNTTYYWQARAKNQYGIVEADGGAWWSFTTENPVPEPFGKNSPVNGMTNVDIYPGLSWYPSTNATDYVICLDESNDTVCDGTWTSTNGHTYANVALMADKTYYWQVKGVNQYGTVEADGGTWWSFRTTSLTPGPFGKLGPANGASGVSPNPILSWQPTSPVSQYEYCIDANNDQQCNSTWINSGVTTTIFLNGLAAGSTYSWQVRAYNGSNGPVMADDGMWWSFTVSDNQQQNGFYETFDYIDGSWPGNLSGQSSGGTAAIHVEDHKLRGSVLEVAAGETARIFWKIDTLTFGAQDAVTIRYEGLEEAAPAGGNWYHALQIVSNATQLADPTIQPGISIQTQGPLIDTILARGFAADGTQQSLGDRMYIPASGLHTYRVEINHVNNTPQPGALRFYRDDALVAQASDIRPYLSELNYLRFQIWTDDPSGCAHTWDNVLVQVNAGGQNYSISGKVTTENGQPVPGVVIADQAGNNTMTGADGGYLLMGLPAGEYDLTPSKEGYSFTPASQHVSLSADTINIHFVAKAAAGSIKLSAGSGIDHILLGWNVPSQNAQSYKIYRSSKPDRSDQVELATVTATSYTDKAGLTKGQSYCYIVKAMSGEMVISESNLACATLGQINLWAPNTFAGKNEQIIVPINIRNATGLKIISADVWIKFDPSIMECLKVDETALTVGFTWEANIDNVLGRVKISTFTSPAKEVFGDGSLFWLTFKVKGSENQTSMLDLEEYVSQVGGSSMQTTNMNGDLVEVPLALSDGLLSVQATGKLGDVDNNGVVAAADAFLTLQMSVGIRPPTQRQLYSADVNGDGTINSADVSMILYYAVHQVWPVPESSGSSGGPPTIIRLGDTGGTAGALVTTSLSAENLKDWAGGDWVVMYDPSQVSGIERVEIDSKAGNAPMAYYDNGAGMLRVAMARNEMVSGNGPLARITLRLAKTVKKQEAALNMTEVALHDAYGRDFVTSALQGKVEVQDGKVLVYHSVYLPLLMR